MAHFIALIFNLITTFMGCMLILRAYIFFQRLSVFDPVARLAWTMTNWLVVPLSQVFHATRRWEWASVAGALAMALLVAVVTRQVTGMPLDWMMVPVCAVFVLIRWILELVLWGTIFLVLMSWLRPDAPGYGMIWRLMHPIVGPISARLPRIAGIDFSPVIIFLIVNVLMYWVTPLSQGYYITQILF